MIMKENMMKNQVFVSILMIRFLPLLLLVPTASFACSLPLDGSPANCPPFDGDFDDIKLPREELRGEIDIYEPMHWHSINQMFIRNARRTQIEKNMTLPSDSINSALENFWEQENGSNGATESEELL